MTRAALGLEIRQVATLVLLAALAEHVQLLVDPILGAEGTGQRHAIERGQVLTLEKPDQVGGAVDSGAVQVLHGVRSSPA